MVQVKTCRLCLKPTLASSSCSLLNPELNAILEALTSIKVNASGPTSSCIKCCLNLKLAHKIQQNILRAEEKLQKSVIFNETTIKEEPTFVISETRCVICQVKVEDNLIEDHIKMHFGNSNKCNLCNLELEDFRSYKEHLLNHPVNNLVFICETCGSTFDNHSSYTAHLKSETCLANENLFYKDLVASGFRSNLAEKLVDLAKQNPPNLKPIKQVNKTRKRKRPERKNVPERELKKLKSASQLSDFTCDKCNLSFSTLEEFNRHPHGRKPCPMCKKEISTTNLHTHMKIHVNEPKVCHYCGGSYPNAECLRSHIEYKHEVKIYKCEECKLEFQSRQRYYEHMKKKHTKPEHVCDICGKRFFYKHVLKKHISGTHFSERPHACEICNQKFSGRYVLGIHMRKHTNEAPYKCEVCTESFRQEVSLRTHLKSKHNIKEQITAICKVCGKGFASGHALLTHMLKIHDEIVRS